MKTKEQIEERISLLQNMFDDAKEDRQKELDKVSKRIADNSGDPEYIIKWIECWMQNANYYKEVMEDLDKQITRLEWIIAEE